MTLADLNEANQVAMLTRGIPNRLMRTQIAAARPKSTEEWLQVATTIEASLNLNSQKDDRKPAQRRQRDPDQIAHHVDDASAGQGRQRDRQNNQRQDSARPPPGPCPVCKAIFSTREMHWKRDCPQVRQAQASLGAKETLPVPALHVPSQAVRPLLPHRQPQQSQRTLSTHQALFGLTLKSMANTFEAFWTAALH